MPWLNPPSHSPVSPAPARTGAHQAHLTGATAAAVVGLSGEGAHLCAEFPGFPPVVRVQEGDPFPFGFPDAAVARAGYASVFLADVADLRRPGRGQVRGMVGGTIVDDDDLTDHVGREYLVGLIDQPPAPEPRKSKS